MNNADNMEKVLAQLVRIGTVTDVDPVSRMARVKYSDTGMISGKLFVLAARSYLASPIKVTPWMPQVNATVLILYLPILDGDGFILGEIGALGTLKQWTDQ